jgi:hypothetical protein
MIEIKKRIVVFGGRIKGGFGLGMKGDGMILRSKKSSDVWVFKEVLKKI